MITVRELATLWRISYDTALDLCHRADFPSRKFGNRFRVDETKLEDWFLQKGEFLKPAVPPRRTRRA